MDVSQAGIELQDIGITNDLEAQTRAIAPTTRFTWRRSLVTQRAGTGLSSASIRSHWSVQWVARWTPRQSPTVANPFLCDATASSAARAEYITAVMGDGTRSEIVDAACQWQVSFLEKQIKKGWISSFRRVLNGVDTCGLKPSSDELSITFQVLAAMVKEFRRDDRALVQIVDELYNGGVLIETAEPEDSEYQRSPANQMVFIALGLISMLYAPELNPTPDNFEISTYQAQNSRTSGTPERRRLVTKSRTYKSYKESVDHMDENVAMLLRRFGTIIPHCQRSLFSGQLSPGPGFAPLAQDVTIELSRLNYRYLCRAIGISIQWVDCLSLHLEFDRSGKVLKLFRFPSVCLMMCRSHGRSTFAQIFSDSMNCDNSQAYDYDEAKEYYKEVLLSFRLIFGQARGSVEDFNRQTRIWATALEEHSDPLLTILCGQTWESEQAWSVYDEIGAGEAADRYSPSEDFPYWGKRLLVLQEYVREHRPNNLIELWHDQANKWNWWMLWAFVILGCLTLLIGIFQIFLQAVQIYYTIYPPH